MLSSADHEMILDAAFQIIDASTNNEAIFNEACHLSKKIKLDGQDANPHQCVEKFLSVTCQTHQSNNSDKVGFFTAPVLAQQVIELTKKCQDEDCPLLSDTVKENFTVITEVLKSADGCSFSKKLFTSMIEKHELSLEMVWNLNKIGMMSLDTYMTRKLLMDRQLQERLCLKLISLYSGKVETLTRRQEILWGFTSALIKKGFEEGKTADKKAAVQVLDDVFQDILCLCNQKRETDNLALPIDFLMLEVHISKEILKKFSMHTLSTILSYGEKVTVSECLESSEEWKHIRINEFTRALVKQLFLPLDFKDAIGILTRHLDHGQIGGTSALIFLSVLYTSFSDTSKFLQTYIKDELTAGLEISDKKKLSTAFLLVRQNAIIGQGHDFPGYATWYQSMFDGANQSPATTRPTFTCLVKFLSSLVPSESSEYLKVHIFKRPYIPPKCKDVYDDYVALAKTRLHDLRVPVTDSGDGIYGDVDNGDSNKSSRMNKNSEDPAEKDVEKALESYRETRKIPTALIEASIFRRPYFMGKFLPALLKPRHLPDEPDLKMMLIEEIKNSGKIPAPLFKRYLEDCEKEKQALLDGVFDVDDEDEVDEMVLSPPEQLVRRLDKYRDVLCKGEEDTKNCLHQVKEKMCDLLASAVTPGNSTFSPTSVDLTKPQEGDLPAQAAAAVTNCLSQLIHLWLKPTHCQMDNGGKILRGAMALVSALVKQFPVLVQHLCSHMLSKFIQQKRSSEIPGVAAVCVSLMTVLNLTNPQLVVKHRHGRQGVHSCTLDTLVAALIHSASLRPGHNQEFMLRFYLEYMRIVFSLLDAEEKHIADADVVEICRNSMTEKHLIPGLIVKTVEWLVRRFGLFPRQLRPGVAVSSRSALCPVVNAVLSHDRWQLVSIEHKLFLHNWVEFELTLDPAKDNLSHSERMTMMWELSSHFLNNSENTGGLELFCGDLLIALVQCSTRAGMSQDDMPAKSADTVVIFLQLLCHLVRQLAPCSSEDTTWLTSIIEHNAVMPEQKDTLLRFILDLPSHLMFCNSSQETVTTRHVEMALTVLGHFARSSYTREVCLSLDATIYCIQAYIHAKSNSKAVTDLVPFEIHPLITASVLAHKKILEDLGLFSQLRPLWASELKSALLRVQSLHDPLKEFVVESGQTAMIDGTALFVMLLQSNETRVSNDPFSRHRVSSGETIQAILYFLELTVICLTKSGQWHRDTQQDKDHVLAKAFWSMVSQNGDFLCPLLNPEHSDLSKFRCALGIDASPSLLFLRELCLLRLSVELSAQQLVRCATASPTQPVLDIYKRCLFYARDNGISSLEFFEEICQSKLTTWIKCLVDNTSHMDMQRIQVPETGSVGEEVILFRYIEEKKKGWI